MEDLLGLLRLFFETGKAPMSIEAFNIIERYRYLMFWHQSCLESTFH